MSHWTLLINDWMAMHLQNWIVTWQNGMVLKQPIISTTINWSTSYRFVNAHNSR